MSSENLLRLACALMVRFLSEADILDGAAIPHAVRPGSLQEQPGLMQGSAITFSYSYSSGRI